MSAFPFGTSSGGERRVSEHQRSREKRLSRARTSDPVRRQAMIAEGAYYRAERRGFAPGHELDDWLAAEAELARGPAVLAGPEKGGTS
jgi:Protein of unknown function (DUF2934)